MIKLKEYRLKFRYSQRDMGQMLGISKTFYWQLENNQRRLSYDMAVKIASIFDVTPDILFLDEFKTKK